MVSPTSQGPPADPRVGVLLMARHLDLGGTERQLCEMARSLDPARFAVHVACFRPGGIRAQEVQAAGIPVTILPLQSFKSPRGLWRTIQALRAYVRRHDIRLVHAFDPPSVLFTGLAAPFLRRDAALLSSQRCFREVGSAVRQRVVYLADLWADGIVVNCDALRRHRESLGVGGRLVPVHLCYNGLEVDRFQRLTDPPRPAVMPRGATIIGTICGLRPEKGLPTLLRAFARLVRTHPDAFLVFVGDGTEREALEAQAHALAVSDRCLFQAKAADVVPWLSLMDIFVLPSAANEALSNALMEAMACGCACVASDVGGNPELVLDGETGLLFPARDEVALAERLTRLVGDRLLRRRLALAGTARITAQFTLPASARRMGAIYDGLIGRHTEWAASDVALHGECAS